MREEKRENEGLKKRCLREKSGCASVLPIQNRLLEKNEKYNFFVFIFHDMTYYRHESLKKEATDGPLL